MHHVKQLDLTSLVNAIDELKDALRYYHSDLAHQDENLERHLLAASIKAFEYTYELSIKFLRRYLEMSEPSADTIEAMSFPELIRTATEKGLLKNEVKEWKYYREKRNITSHTYDEDKALGVMNMIPDFLLDAEHLLLRLQERVKTL